MKIREIYSAKSGIMLALTAIIALMSACTSEDIRPVDENPACMSWGPIHVLRFTDMEDTGYYYREDIKASGEEQTLTIRLKSFKKGVKEEDQAELWAKIDTMYFYIHEWVNGELVYNYHPVDWSYVNQPDDFYHVWSESENGVPVVKVSLKKNDTSETRRVSLDLWPDVKYQNSPIIGDVDIVQEPAEMQTFNMKIKYKDIYYTTEVTHDEKGDIIYQDEDFMHVMNEIDANPNIETVIMGDGIVYYYDESDVELNKPYHDFLSLPECEQHETLSTRANDGFAGYNQEAGYFAVFEDNTFSGASIAKSFTNLHYTYDLPNLGSLQMNDKISSIALAYNGSDPIACSVLTIWEDSDYNYGDDSRAKHRISIVASSKAPKTTIKDLLKIKMHNSTVSWNDQISSSSFHFGYVDRLLKDY